MCSWIPKYTCACMFNALLIKCSHVYLLWCSSAHMSTCFDVHLLTCLLAFMFTCFYVHMVWYSGTSMFPCFNDHTFLCSHRLNDRILLRLHALTRTCPIAYMLSWSYARTLLWLDTPMLTCFVDIHLYDIHKHVHTLGC